MTQPETHDTPGASQQPVAFKAEVRQLLNILAHSLYTDREIFLRELISNASDALHRIQFEMLTNREVRDAEAELAIHIEVDEEARTITISDSGIGMNATEVTENLGTIAQSGARAFLQQAKEKGRSDSDIIGQFGVGFYSVFTVADQVVVTSRSFRIDDPAIRWEATGGDTYSLGPGERDQRGTTIQIHLKDDAHEFANSWRLEQIIKKHSNFVSFPIYVGERSVNEQKPIWRRPPRDVEPDDYKHFYRQLTMDIDEPLSQVHLSTDAPLDLHSLLFFPRKRERGMIERRTEGKIKLYSRNVLIQEENKDLLPTYFRFIEGVVDSEDLPLNISRETVQSNTVMRQLQKTLTRRVFRELETMAEQRPEEYKEFWGQFGVFLKEGIATDYADRDDLLKLLRFHSTQSLDELTTLEEYKNRMIDGQSEIYYVLAADIEAARRSPHLDPLLARNIEVIFMVDLMDNFMLSSLREYAGHQLRNIDDANLELPGEPEAPESLINDDEFTLVSEHFTNVLGERVTEVRESQVLREHPVRLVATDNMPGREMQRIQQMLGQETTVPPRALEINRGHPLVQRLAQRLTNQADDPVATAISEQLYDNALLLEGLHANPTSMVARIQTLLEAAARAE